MRREPAWIIPWIAFALFAAVIVAAQLFWPGGQAAFFGTGYGVLASMSLIATIATCALYKHPVARTDSGLSTGPAPPPP